MIIGMANFSAAGSQALAWRDSESHSSSYPDFEGYAHSAQLAEKGKFHFLFLGNFPGMLPDNNAEPPSMTPDPVVTIAAMAAKTSHIGFAATIASEWHEPFNVARQFKALDSYTAGRTALNAVTGSNPQAAALYGKEIPSSMERYGRANEFVQIIQALWGAWNKEASESIEDTHIFADYSKVNRLHLQGSYLQMSGALPLPPTPQGQPVMFHSGGSPNSINFAGRYADVYVTEVWTPEEAADQRRQLRNAAIEAGREPDDVKFIVGLMTTIADSKREALDRHAVFMEPKVAQQVRYLSMFFNTSLTVDDLDRALTEEEIENAKSSRVGDPRHSIALKVAAEGWTIRDIINHSVIDYHPAVQGTAQVIADHMEHWFKVGAVDGFWVMPDVHAIDLHRFVDEVVPELQKRGLYHHDYEGKTLRENLGLRDQYGIDSRILDSAE